MKLPFTINDLRFTIREGSAGGTGVAPVESGVAPDSGRDRVAGVHNIQNSFASREGFGRDARNNRRDACSTQLVLNRQSSIINHKSRSGVALVLTLILLSVALVMTLAFLAISSREQDSVTTQTDTATMRLAADAGLAAAEAQIAANVLSTTNPYSFGLLVSTNYPPFAYTNPADFAALQFSPRAPVWLSNTVTHAMENRFYFDLNRNGVDDPSGWVFDPATGATSFQVGDPEWIGVLAHPDQPYGPQNPFIARFAFIALPVGNSLDLNAIHNQTLMPALSYNPMNPANDGYFRNQGVGTWEINLAAFLADLNTNEWDNNFGGAYQYIRPLGFANSGAAFNDAFALLTNRFAGNYNTLSPVAGNNPRGLFTIANSFPPFQNNIDAYTMGPLQTTPAGINVVGQVVTLPWAGADNTNHSFTPGDLFDPAKSSSGFTSRLLNAGSGVSTYDRYTFYRLLAQLGTDTAPESGKMNLNYDNLTVTNGSASATNFMAWQPLAFFTNAADRLLKAHTAQWATTYIHDINGVLVPTNNPAFVATFNTTSAFGVSSIPVLVSNRFVYTPAVNRLLQLAANMYDATTNKSGANGSTYDYPSVFRPLFTVVPENGNAYRDVYITGYTNVDSFEGTSDMRFALPIDVSDLAATNLPPNQPVNVYGVPWIVGAKKGFPNFNELAMDSAFQITRKVEVTRPSTTALANTYSYYQLFILSITNQVGVECWNSYANAYTNGVMIYVYDNLRNIVLTNDEGFSGSVSIPLPNPVAVASWPGYNANQPSLSFQIPLNTSVMVLSNSIYRFNQPASPYLTPYLGDIYEANVTGFPQPHWWLTVTNDLRVIMVDTTANRVIDYVELSGPNSSRDLTSEIWANYDTDTGANDLWATNWNNGSKIPQGLASQIQVSLGGYSPNTANGGPWPAGSPADIAQEQDDAVDGFRAFFHLGPKYNNIGSQQAIAAADMTNAMQAPFTPTATVVQHVSWQANDPLVHYLASDLNWASAIKYDRNVTALTDSSDGDNLGQVNMRYAPWGKMILAGTDQVDLNMYSLAFKDPLVASSDNWDFPNYKLPTVGWLGRVHRGTPWQTVYLKSTNILTWVQNNTGPTTWRDWTGNYNGFDANNAGPAADWLLFDLFTTAFNDNATRGKLSVNVGADNPNPSADLAAWSALFSGIVVPTNSTGGYVVIKPAGSAGVSVPVGPPPSPNSPLSLGYLVQNGTNGINDVRSTFHNADGLVGSFEHVGDILAVPALTDHSPFLTGLDPNTQISDEMYEWVPQQAMSLLSVSSSPRYVIYTYGQALKPAKNGTYLGSGAYFGMVTNYQVVSEIATRAVLRLETERTSTNGVLTVTPPRAVIESYNILPPD